MKQLQTTLNGKEILLVVVPEGSGQHHIDKNEIALCFAFYGWKYIDLSAYPGNWKLLGLCSEIKEEVAAGLVKVTFNSPRLYADYRHQSGPYFLRSADTAKESINSFVIHHKLNPETTVLLLRQ